MDSTIVNVGSASSSRNTIPFNNPATTTLALLEALAPAGAALAVLLVATSLLRMHGFLLQRVKSLDYAAFLVQLPATAIRLAFLGRRDATRAQRCLLWIIGGLCVLICGWYIAMHTTMACVIAAVGQMALAWKLRRLSFRGKSAWSPSTIGALFVVLLAAWTTAARLPWFYDYSHALLTTVNGIIFIPIIMSVCYALYSEDALPTTDTRLRRGISIVWDALTIIIICLASTRTTGLFDFLSIHHWGVFVAPAEMVRQGGWLLWDVPSQYGFLAIALPAALPVKSVWNALYVLTSIAQIAAVSFSYYVLRSAGRGMLFRAICSGVVIAMVFITPLIAEGLISPQVYPSIGAYRYIWVYATLAVLLRLSRPGLSARAFRSLLTAGCIAWAVGLLWSCESAFYTSAVWLPAYILTLAQQWSVGGVETLRRPSLRETGWLAVLPVITAAVAFGAVDLFYKIRLGHGPDWKAFSEYVLAFKDGFGGWPLDPYGSIWTLLIGAAAGMAALLAIFRTGIADDGRAPLLAGCVGLVAGTTAYCIGRSHPNNVLNCLPFAILTLFVAIRCLYSARTGRAGTEERGQPIRSLRFLITSCTIPIVVVLLTTPSHKSAVDRMWLTTLVTAHCIDVDHLRPALDPIAEKLLNEAGVHATDPVFMYDLNVMPREPLRRSAAREYMTPFSPLAAVYPLSPDRAVVYLSRFAARTKRGGWVLVPSKSDLADADVPYDVSWLMPALQSTFREDRIVTSRGYTLIHFSYPG